jgi:hypothetical protein
MDFESKSSVGLWLIAEVEEAGFLVGVGAIAKPRKTAPTS